MKKRPIMFKICTKCKIKKLLIEFYNNRNGKNGSSSWCKICTRKKNAIYRKNNPELIKLRKNKWHRDNPDYGKLWHKNNKERTRINSKNWRKDHIELSRLINNRSAKKRRSTVKGKLNHAMSMGIRDAIGKNKKGRHWESLVSFILDDLKKHLESKFLSGMTWANYGRYGWHIDHIVPIDFFQFNKPEDQEFQYCWSLDNLQPLWAKDNWVKNNKINTIKYKEN